MPIPEFTEDGLLPNSIHDCSLEELEGVFGRFQRTDCRINLTRKLKEYIQELQRTGLGTELIIDGSYATRKDNPSDIDLILGLEQELDYSAPVNPYEYNLASNKAVKRKYGFDVFVEKVGSERFDNRLRFFHRVKENPDLSKGLLRIKL